MTKASPTNESPSTSEDGGVSDPTTMLLSEELNRDESGPPNQQSEEEQEEIRALAYQKWEAAGCPEGDGTEFWLEAEQEIKVD